MEFLGSIITFICIVVIGFYVIKEGRKEGGVPFAKRDQTDDEISHRKERAGSR
ncbi:hypothetical protein ABET51_07825 [Metabacillus fastidiosus]|uniref:hypothetical protein n=1 Tax=Metabacillus fastidiosus TaxID=1458 RepID=UPI002E2178D2|nr:hypothetical protein [Metabacillus fastidiosus]